MVSSLPILDHTRYLEPLQNLPTHVWPHKYKSTLPRPPHQGFFSCDLCGVGTHAVLPLPNVSLMTTDTSLPASFRFHNKEKNYPAMVHGNHIQILTEHPLAKNGTVIQGTLKLKNAQIEQVELRTLDLLLEPDGRTLAQRFLRLSETPEIESVQPHTTRPLKPCRKFYRSLDEKPGLYPLHLRPSVLDITQRRVPLFYKEGLERFASLVLEHRPPRARTLIYGSGRLDYFAVFAIQEVFRLLGVRNMTSNCEHGYLAAGSYMSHLAGAPAPFVNLEQATTAPNAFYLLSGWNGMVSHPPVFDAILSREDFDGYYIDVMMTESAREIARRFGPERVIILRSGGDSQFILGIMNRLLYKYPTAFEARFVSLFSDRASYEAFVNLASEEQFSPKEVAHRLAPEFAYRERIHQAIRDIAKKLTRKTPIHIPSLGLSQTGGIVPHCLWANVLASLGKLGIDASGTLQGGVLQLPGQVNHESHLQGFSPQHFMGRIPVDASGASEAARRMELPADAYGKMLEVSPRLLLDYSEPDSRKELYIFFGSQYASSMMNRSRWLRKLKDGQTQFIVIDPSPDAFSLAHAALILPVAPHVASTKLYQNGEWRLNLSLPRRKAPGQTRSDTTLVYDLMATIARMLRESATLRMQHPDIANLIDTGYVPRRFEAKGLPRYEGEVDRALLWQRIQDYLSGKHGNGLPLYCRPEHENGEPIRWETLVTQGSLLHGGVGTRKHRLDYDKGSLPFTDIYRQPVRYRFFVPTSEDLQLPRGIILNSGRASLAEATEENHFALNTVNSGKRSYPEEIPEDNPLYVSLMLAERYNLQAGDRVWITNRATRQSLVLRVFPSARLKGETVYLSIHKNWREIHEDRYVNLLTSHRNRCPYSGQTGLKCAQVELQKVDDFLMR